MNVSKADGFVSTLNLAKTLANAVYCLPRTVYQVSPILFIYKKTTIFYAGVWGGKIAGAKEGGAGGGRSCCKPGAGSSISCCE